MKKLTGITAGLCLLFTGMVVSFNVAGAQGMSGTHTGPPPKVLVIQREVLKPGRAGDAHLKTESLFVQAMTASKWPTHYLGMESLSGVSRALFLMGYPSFAAWEQDTQAQAKNATFTAAMDRATVMDGEQLTDYSTGVFLYNEGMSLRADQADISRSRYFEILEFKVRPGHDKDWSDLVAIYKSAYEKAVPDAGWAMFDAAYGSGLGGLHLLIRPRRSLAELDQNAINDNKVMSLIGENGMKKASELEAACIESEQLNLFAFNPKMSYPADDIIKGDPGFWKPKASAPAKKAATP